MKEKKPYVIVEIDGGVVSKITSDKDINLVIVDHDNLENIGSKKELIKQLYNVTFNNEEVEVVSSLSNLMSYLDEIKTRYEKLKEKLPYGPY